MKKRVLLGYLALTLLGIGALFVHFAAEIRTTGVATGPLLAATGLAAVAAVLGALSLRTIGRAGPAQLGFVGARYLRIVFSLNGLMFAIVLFGTRREASARLAAHLFGAMALHRFALLWPAGLTRALRAFDRWPLLRAGEVLIFNLLATTVVAEGAVRSYYAASGRGFFTAHLEHPFTRKLVSELFGQMPNRQGYNDDEFEVDKDPDVTRVAAIGDSFFVAAVPRAQGVISRAEAELQQSAAAPVDVYNFGISASNIDDYRIVLEEEALGFRPDVVLLGIYFGNDLRIATPNTALHYRSYAIFRAVEDIRRRIEERRLEYTGEFRDITRTAAQPGAASSRPITTRERYLESVRANLPFFTEASSPSVRRAWYDSLAGLAQIADRCAAHGVPLLVVLSPAHAQVSRAILAEGARSAGIDPAELDVAVPQRRLVAFFAERGIPVLDLLPAFQRAALTQDPDDFYLPNDTHWSVAGNEIAGHELALFLASQLPRHPTLVHASPEDP